MNGRYDSGNPSGGYSSQNSGYSAGTPAGCGYSSQSTYSSAPSYGCQPSQTVSTTYSIFSPARGGYVQTTPSPYYRNDVECCKIL